MPRRAGVRCTNCGHLVSASSVWAINGFCSECLQPLGATANGASATGAEPEPKSIVLRWFDAFNARELEGMLACMHPRVDFHPLRLHGLDSVYHGHDGVRRWLADLEEMEHWHRIELSEVRDPATAG